MNSVGLEKLRNFSIISHIDHGKSTLADRFLETTKTFKKEEITPQFLDMMDLEKEKGITIKMQPVRMAYRLEADEYHLNLIDTPGHADFSYEVSRALAAVEGVVLLVDAVTGVQAQTVSNLELAQKQNLEIIPVINKIDLSSARPNQVAEQISNLIKIKKDKILKISAKEGTNVDKLLEEIIKRIPPPKGDISAPFRGLIFDSKYDPYKGVIAFVRVVDGQVKKDQQLELMAKGVSSKSKEVGFFNPNFFPTKLLSCGEIGYIATGIKLTDKVRVGDTIVHSSSIKSHQAQSQNKQKLKPLAGYKNPKPMVFASLYPENPHNFKLLKEGLEKLKLNDPSLTYTQESKKFLGRGFRCGFLGTLHVEIVSRRLSQEYGLSLIISTPSVVYKIVDEQSKEHIIYSPTDWLPQNSIKKTQEPWVKLEIITPSDYIGNCMKLLDTMLGEYKETKYIGKKRLILTYHTPLREIVDGLYEKLKNTTQGYASMNYQKIGFREADLVKMEILIAGEKEEAFSKIIARGNAYREGKSLVQKLKKLMPPQQFKVPLQAQVEGRIIARETLDAARKDVTASLYGGDYTRKKKLIQKQRQGKKQMAKEGKVNIPSEVFLKIFKEY